MERKSKSKTGLITEKKVKKTGRELKFEIEVLQKCIKELEKQVEETELKAVAFSTMVDIAKKEFMRLQGIKIGRDALFDLLRAENMLIRNRIRRVRTTNSYHRFHKYVNLLQKNGIKISMTENGDPRENAIAERVNGIIKNEYLKNRITNDFNKNKQIIKQSVDLYNNDRPHNSIGNLTPNEVHKNNLKTKKLWKKYYQTKEKNITFVNQFQD